MSIESILSTARTAVTSTAAAPTKATEKTKASKFDEIAAKYDPKHMHLEQVNEFANELYSNGLIADIECVSMICTAMQAEKSKLAGAQGKFVLSQIT